MWTTNGPIRFPRRNFRFFTRRSLWSWGGGPGGGFLLRLSAFLPVHVQECVSIGYTTFSMPCGGSLPGLAVFCPPMSGLHDTHRKAHCRATVGWVILCLGLIPVDAGGWWPLAVGGGWRVAVGGGWRLAVGGWWRLAGGGWRVAVGVWRLVVLGGCPQGLSLTKKKENWGS